MLTKTIRSKLSLNTVLQFFNSCTLLYIYYQLNTKIINMSSSIDNITSSLINSVSCIMDKTLINFSDIFLNKLKNQNEHLLANHLEKMNFLHSKYLQNTSHKTEMLLLKLHKQQELVSAKIAPMLMHPSQNTIHYVYPSNSKTMIIATVLISTLLVVGACIFVPKAITMTQDSFMKLKYLSSEIIRLIPGSNTAEGFSFLKQNTAHQIFVRINSGVPEFLFINTHTGESECLITVLDRFLIDAAGVSATRAGVDITTTISQIISGSGSVIDPASLF